MGSQLVDRAVAAYTELSDLYATDWAALEARNEGLFVCSGGLVTGSATLGKVDLAAGTDFATTTEFNYVASATPVQGTMSATATTVAAGSNGVHTNTFAGAGSLVVASTAGAPAAGQVAINRAGTISVVSYTSIDATHFLGCTLVTGWPDVTMATGDAVTVLNNDLTLKRWAIYELDPSTGLLAINLGTAAGSPTKPALTATRIYHASLLLQPTSGNTSALNIDTLLTTVNAKSKLMDARQLMTVHGGRRIAHDFSGGSLANPAALATLLAAPVPLPANSLSVGDIIEVIASGRFVPGATADTTIQFQLSIGGTVVFDVTTNTLTKAVNTTDARQWTIRFTILFSLVGAVSGGTKEGSFLLGAVQASLAADPLAGANGGAGGVAAPHGGNVTLGDSTTALNIDLQAVRGPTATNSSIQLRHFSVKKFPV